MFPPQKNRGLSLGELFCVFIPVLFIYLYFRKSFLLPACETFCSHFHLSTVRCQGVAFVILRSVWTWGRGRGHKMSTKELRRVGSVIYPPSAPTHHPTLLRLTLGTFRLNYNQEIERDNDLTLGSTEAKSHPRRDTKGADGTPLDRLQYFEKILPLVESL